MLIYLMEINDDVQHIVDKYHLKTYRLKGRRVAVEIHGDKLDRMVTDAAGSDVNGFHFGGINDE